MLLSISAGHAQWENRFNGEGDFSDKFNASAIDASGSVYEAGFTMNADQSKDILIAKLNSSGELIWTAFYNGPGNGPDEATSVALDNEGSLIVAGYQKGVGTGFDFITLKYDGETGDMIWNVTYNYTANEFDQINALTVDAAGNIFIAGQSDKDVSLVNNDDYVVIKYNSNGVEQWSKRTNGLGNSTDRPSKIAIDPDGNVVVTGRSDNLSDDDYMTVMYDGNTGAELWRKYFDRTHHDRATGMVVNPSNGNIIVTGRSNNGTNYDYATVCYNSSGVAQWQAIFDYVDDDRATAISIDNSGNIYISGQSDADASAVGVNYEVLTVKYNASGTQQYAQSFGGAALGDDIPVSMLADAVGNIFIAAQSDTDPGAGVANEMIALKYNSAGVLQWNSNYNNAESINDIASSICLTISNTIIISGYTESAPQKNALAIKFDAGGNIAWDYSFNGQGDNSDNSHVIIRDSHNNSFIGGYSFGYESDRNFLVMKLGASGSILWQNQINGTSTTQSTDDATCLVLDNEENIYAAGFTKNSGTGYDMTLAKYSNAGDSLWVRNYNYDLANETDKATAIASDGSNIYMGGRSDSDPTIISNDDIILIKYSAGGVLSWIQRYNGAGNGIDQLRSLKISSSGFIYLAGKTFNGSDFDMVLIKYNDAGIQQWVKKYNSGNGDDECFAMTIDQDENIFLTGYEADPTGGDKNISLVKYSAEGTMIWHKSYDGVDSGNDEATSIDIDEQNKIYLCGTVDHDTSSLTLNSDIVTLAFENDGTLLWDVIYDGAANGNDDASEIAVDASGQIYVTGQTDQGGEIVNYDFITITYDNAGNQTDIQFYNGTGNGSDVANTLITAANGYYVTGGSTGATSQRDIVTILYGTTPSSIDATTISDSGITIFPNPFSEQATVILTDFENHFGDITASVTDITGRVVIQMNMNGQTQFQLNRNNLPPGVYVLNLIQEKQIIQQARFIIN